MKRKTLESLGPTRGGSCLAPMATRQRGLTLVEWMISIALGLFLVIGLSALIGQQSGTRRSIDNTGRLIENGRYAAQVMSRDIQLAGYLGELTTIPAALGVLPDPCALPLTPPALAAVQAAMPVHIQGMNYAAAAPLHAGGFNGASGLPAPSCVSNLKAGTDILVVRRADVSPVTVAAAANGQIYLQTGIASAGTAFESILNVAPAANPEALFTLATKDGSLAPLRRYLTHIYYVSSCSVCAPSDGIPTLKRVELVLSGGAMTTTTVSLVEGIDNLQIDYGLDVVPPTAAADADGSVDGYTSGTFSDEVAAAMTVTDWANVVAVRLHIVARSIDMEAGHRDTKTYNLGLAGDTVATNDAFKRHVFTQLVRVVNPSSRRAL